MTSSPSNYTLPFRGCTIPSTVFSVVDLPDALPPSRQTSSPRLHLEIQALEDVDLPVVRVDGVELQQRLGRRPVLVAARFAHFVAVAFVPRYASTTRGSVATASNEPSAILTPWSSATTRSEMPSTTCMSCSITRIV